MSRRRGKRCKPDPDTLKGVACALQLAFSEQEDAEDAITRRLIEQMKDFEGTHAEPKP